MGGAVKSEIPVLLGVMHCNVLNPAVRNTSFFFLQPSSPFRRVRAEEIEVDNRVADNSFDAKVRGG